MTTSACEIQATAHRSDRRARKLLAEILDDRRRSSNPGFARDVHQRLLIDDTDGASAEHSVVKSRRHVRRDFDFDPAPLEEIDQRRQGPVAAQARAVIFRRPVGRPYIAQPLVPGVTWPLGPAAKFAEATPIFTGPTLAMASFKITAFVQSTEWNGPSK